jgi:hypothetical protein
MCVTLTLGAASEVERRHVCAHWHSAFQHSIILHSIVKLGFHLEQCATCFWLVIQIGSSIEGKLCAGIESK